MCVEGLRDKRGGGRGMCTERGCGERGCGEGNVVKGVPPGTQRQTPSFHRTHPWRRGRHLPLPIEMATEAGGTHPTRMHSF